MSTPEPCPRSGSEDIDTVTESPVPALWSVFCCLRCRYMWRSSEPDTNSRRASYPDRLRWTVADIEQAPEVPPVEGVS